MKKKLPEPSNDIYAILDDAGLRAGALLATREPMAKIVEVIRNEIVLQFKEYLEKREAILTKEQKHGKV